MASQKPEQQHVGLTVVGAEREGRAPTGRLPAQPTVLVGREHDVESARREILAGEGRLLTLIGPPGVGKTRLALEIVAGLTDRFEHGVTFVDLAPIREVHLVAPAMTRALGIWETGRGSAQSTLESYLRERRALLLLDNFEHVVDAAPLLSELLAACPRLVLIVTSRSALRVRWERELPVAPLPLPRAYPEAGTVDLGENPAVALFVARARSIRPDFALTDQNGRDVAAICIRLDGLPLAIELAAGLARLLPPRTIAERLGGQHGASAALSSSLGLLTGGPRDLPLRQRTLRAALTWSYELLDPTGQAAFRRLATFAGSFSLEAAASVVGDEIQDSDAAVATLIDQSLVRREPTDDGTARFRILQTLREYGLEQLGASGEANETWRRQAQFFIEMMARAERQHADQWGRQQAAWLQRVDTDLDNIRAVLEWCASPDGDLEAGQVLAGSTCRFWDDEATFAAHWGAGRALGPDEAVELALRTEPAGDPERTSIEHVRPNPALTPRERQTVELIALGYTNRQIAERLVISRGAAANYVQRVLEKLGFHARAQVAAWAVERGGGASRHRE